MKITCKNTSTFFFLFLITSCSFSQKQASSQEDIKNNVKLIVLDPGHFHASLLQKSSLVSVSDTVQVYAPIGKEVNQYLNDVKSYNQRVEKPTSWIENIYTGDDYLSKMLSERKGNVVILAGNNQKKTNYIFESVKAGYNVLSDKPLAINKKDFSLLVKAYQTAKEKNLLLYDLMTERHDILNIVEKQLLHHSNLFGTLQNGSLDHPAISMESVHHFFKNVSGKPLIRPTWYYDTEQQGEGIADVTTHLIDLVNWQCFPEESIHYQSDIKVLEAHHWPTRITLSEFSQSTQTDSFPPYLNKDIKGNVLEVMANGTLHYTVKGVHVHMKVIWNYTPPVGGGDTFMSIKKGDKATLKIIQNKDNNFVKQLYIQKNETVDSKQFETLLQKTIEQLQKNYSFLSVKKMDHDGLYLIDIPQKDRLGHESHFSKVAESYFAYLTNRNMPEWENENTISKYYITTTAVELAEKENK